MTPDPIDTEAPPAVDGLTVEDSAKIASVLLDPTIKRMTTLLGSLVQQTGTGDYAMWVALAAMDEVIVGLDWQNAPTPAALRLVNFGALLWHRSAVRLEQFSAAITHQAAHPDEPFPALTPLTEADILACYQDAEALP